MARATPAGPAAAAANVAEKALSVSVHRSVSSQRILGLRKPLLNQGKDLIIIIFISETISEWIPYRSVTQREHDAAPATVKIHVYPNNRSSIYLV